MSLAPGTRIGPYRVEQAIGRGGFALVYRAHDPRLNAWVAIKVLADNHAFDPDIRARFSDEARALRALNHPAIISVFDVGTTDSGQPFMVLDLANRGSLQDRLASGVAAGLDDVEEIVDFLAEALTALHSDGLVHRDIKPSNILIHAEGDAPGVSPEPDERANVRDPSLLAPAERLLLSDLGLAKNLSLASGLTVGAGSPGYAAPEQLGGAGQIDGRADLYSASALIAELITGRLPAEGESWASLLEASPHRALKNALRKSLASDPNHRAPNATEWQRSLKAAVGADRYPVARPASAARWQVAAALAALTVATAGLLYSSFDRLEATAQDVRPTVLVFEAEVQPATPQSSGAIDRPAPPAEPPEATVEGNVTGGLPNGNDSTNLGSRPGSRSSPDNADPVPAPTPVQHPATGQRGGDRDRPDPADLPSPDDPEAANVASTREQQEAIMAAEEQNTRLPDRSPDQPVHAEPTEAPSPQTQGSSSTSGATAAATSSPTSRPTVTPAPTRRAAVPAPTATSAPTTRPTTTPPPTATPEPLLPEHFAVEDIEVSELDGVAHVVVRYLGPRRDPVEVKIATVSDTATKYLDYSGIGDITIAFDSANRRQTVPIQIKSDDLTEETETLFVRLYLPGVREYARGVVSIRDSTSEPDPRPVFSIDTGQINEDVGSATVTVSMTPPQDEPVALVFATDRSGGTASQGANGDFFGTSGNLLFAPGETSATATVEIRDDAEAEPTETIRFRVYFGPGHPEQGRTQAAKLIEILDDDGDASTSAGAGSTGAGASTSAEPALSIEPVQVNEDDGFAEVTVRLSAPSRSEVQVEYSTGRGTLTPRADYHGVGGGAPLIFAPGETVKIWQVQILDDATVEPDEQVPLRIFRPVGATIDTAESILTVIDDD